MSIFSTNHTQLVQSQGSSPCPQVLGSVDAGNLKIKSLVNNMKAELPLLKFDLEQSVFKVDLEPISLQKSTIFLKPKIKKVGFFTPVSYERPSDAAKEHGLRGRAVEFFDSYFALGGKECYVVRAPSKKEGVGTDIFIRKQPWYILALKVVSYLTLVIPAVMLIGKAIARSQIEYKMGSFFPDTSIYGNDNRTSLDK